MRRISVTAAAVALALALGACGQPSTPGTTPGTGQTEPTTGLAATSGLAATQEVPAEPGADATQIQPTSDVMVETTTTEADATTPTAATVAETTTPDADATTPTAATMAETTTTEADATTPTAATMAETTTPDADEAMGAEDILEVAEADSRFSTLVTALRAAGLESTLAEAGPYTIFAPTDEAFAKLPPGTLAALQQNPELLRSILLYHVAQGRLLAADVANETEAQTIEGSPIEISVENGTVMLNDTATVLETEVEAENGVIHAIDTVLLPPDVQLPSVQ